MIEVSCSDIDFYERKIQRLETDILHLHEQLTAARLRLRTAEDFQIKYDLLLRQSQNELHRLKGFEKAEQARRQEAISARLKEANDKWKSQRQELEDRLRQDTQREVQTLRAEKSDLEKKWVDLSSKRQEMELFAFKLKKYEKENENLREQQDELRRFYEKQKEEESTALKSHLNNNFKERLNNERKANEAKVQSLQKRIAELEVARDNQIIKQHAETSGELSKLRDELEAKNKDYTQQLQKLAALLEKKNAEIRVLLEERVASEARQERQIRQVREYAKQLQTRLFQREKAHESELIGVVERMRIAREAEVEELKKQLKHAGEQLQRQHDQWRTKILNHDREVENLKQRWDEDRRKLLDEKNSHKRKISQLGGRLRDQEGQREVGDTQLLINSLRQLESKEDQLGNYENGITFLQRQNKKCALKLEQKSRIIGKLHRDINELKVDHEKELSQTRQRQRRDRKESTERIANLEAQIRDLHERVRGLEREARRRDNQAAASRAELEAQNRGLKDLVEELQRDYNRVIENKKNVEASYRDERQRGMTSKGDVNLIKKQKWLELQKQKNELQIIFREKEQQLRSEFEAEIDQSNREISKLRQRADIAQKQVELLKKQNDQLSQELKLDREGTKYAEYNKQIASLNLQIALTQNIYESLKRAKSPLQDSFAGFRLSEEEEAVPPESLLLSFNPSSYK